MDVNNTRFHLLLGRRDWAQHLPGATSPPEDAPAWDAERQALTLPPRVLRLPAPPPGERLRSSDRRGAARDRYGNWYAVDAAGTGITFLPAFARTAETFWPRPDAGGTAPAAKEAGGFGPAAPEPAPPAVLPLRGLAVTTRHYLVAGVTGEEPGLLVFDLHAGGPPARLRWPVAFHPAELAPRPSGGVWVLDAPPGGGVPRLWSLDRFLRVEGCDEEMQTLEPGAVELFRPLDGAPRERPARAFPAGVPLPPAPPLAAAQPAALEVLPDDTLLVLHVEPSVGSWVARYDRGRPCGAAASLDALLEGRLAGADEAGAAYRFTAHDVGFVPDAVQLPPRVTGTLFVADGGGRQAFAFRLAADDDRLELELLNAHYPMRGYGGRALVGLADGCFFDAGDRWLLLAALPRGRYGAAAVFEMDPALAFDGKSPDCVWHRLFLDACIPPGTAVEVETRAANTREELAHARWEREPALYRRGTGSEIPYYRPFTAEEEGREGTGTWELLFQRAAGRFLLLRLTLRGNGRRTPRLHALRAYYGRFSYLERYLPAVYRQDEASASFLDRFLANVEGTFTDLEGRIAEAQALFDPGIADAAYLDWLAGWMGVVLDPAFDERRRRLFLRHAVSLFSQRGTPAGIARAVRLVTDPCADESLFAPDAVACETGRAQACGAGTRLRAGQVRLIEHFLLRKAPGVVHGDPTDLTGPVYATESAAWTPAQGADPLHARFQDFLRGRYASAEALSAAWGESHADFSAVRLPPLLPQQEAKRLDWQAFLGSRLGFTYAEAEPGDAGLYRAFLKQRYRRAAALHAAHQRGYGGFGQVPMPEEDDFPAGGARLDDWIRFVSLVLPVQRNAHRFTVLVPTRPGSDLAEQTALMALVERVVAAEKPAHTLFEVKPYWALFRVGAARLGLDTLLDEGSRFTALLLGRGRLAESYLPPAHPWDVTDRMVAGRDRLGLDP